VTSAPSEWVPAFPGQRPPFPPGNQLSVRHGAYSPRRVEPVAAELLAAVLGEPPAGYLAEPVYRPALEAWAQAEARVRLLDEWVSGMPISVAAESRQGQVSPLELLRRWEATASSHRARLGLDPLSRARLGRDVAAARVDVAALMAEMKRRDEASPAGEEPTS
jgi:hypothetical protein